jgi:hypothetical protein
LVSSEPYSDGGLGREGIAESSNYILLTDCQNVRYIVRTFRAYVLGSVKSSRGKGSQS